ncbi:hypothetical protein D3C81_1766840 [compost metagenome]
MVAVGRAETQRHRTVLAQCIGPQMPAIEITVEFSAVHTRLGFTADQANTPLLVDGPIRAHNQTLGGMFQGIEVAIQGPAMT